MVLLKFNNQSTMNSETNEVFHPKINIDCKHHDHSYYLANVQQRINDSVVLADVFKIACASKACSVINNLIELNYC